MTDLDIAKQIKPNDIRTIAKKLGLNEDDIEMYGKYKAKLPQSKIDPEKVNQSNLMRKLVFSFLLLFTHLFLGAQIITEDLIKKHQES